MTIEESKKNSPLSNLQEHTIVGLVIFFAIVVRTIYILRVPGLGYDESAYLYLARQIAQGKNAYSDFTLFTSPLYVYLLSAFLSIFGEGEFQARFLSIIMSSISTLVLYLIGREVKSSRMGIITILLYSISSFLIHMDSSNVIEPFLTTISVLTVYLLLKSRESKDTRYLLAVGVLAAIAFFTKTSVVFTILVLLFLVLLWKGGKAFLIVLITFMAASVVLFLPFLLMDFRLSILNIFGYSIVRNQPSMGLLDSVMHIIWWHGDVGIVVLGIGSIAFTFVQIAAFVRKNWGKGLLPLLHRGEAILVLFPLVYFLSFVLVDFWFPYLLYPLFVFFTLSGGYLIDFILETSEASTSGFQIKSLSRKEVRRGLTTVIIVCFLTGATIIEMYSISQNMYNAVNNRNRLDDLIAFFKNSTIPGDTIFSTDPTTALLLGEKRTEMSLPFIGIDAINNVRFAAYYNHTSNQSVLNALVFEGDLDSIETASYEETLFPLMEQSEYIHVDPVFVNNVPDYVDSIEKWLRENTVPVLPSVNQSEKSSIYRTFEKGTNTTLWDGLKASWEYPRKSEEVAPWSLTQSGDKLKIQYLPYYDNPEIPIYGVWTNDCDDCAIFTRKDTYLQINYQTYNYTSRSWALNLVLEIKEENGTTIERVVQPIIELEDTGGQYRRQYFCFYDLLRQYESEWKIYGKLEDVQVQAIYITIQDPPLELLVPYYPIIFSEFQIVQLAH